MSRLDSRGIQDIISNLQTQRTAQLGKIEGLFDQFGVTARQDLEQTLTKSKAQREQNLIDRGLSNTTKRETSFSDLAAQGARGRAQIGEQVASQKAGFLERQLVDPALITNLISAASAANTTPVQASGGINQAALQSPGFGLRPGAGGGGGASGGGGAGGAGFGLRGGTGSPNGTARVITSPKATSLTSTAQAGAAQGARIVQSTNAAKTVSGTTGQASLRSGQASGTGSIRNTATGEGFETRTGQATPSAIGAGATDVTAPAGTGAPRASTAAKAPGDGAAALDAVRRQKAKIAKALRDNPELFR